MAILARPTYRRDPESSHSGYLLQPVIRSSTPNSANDMYNNFYILGSNYRDIEFNQFWIENLRKRQVYRISESNRVDRDEICSTPCPKYPKYNLRKREQDILVLPDPSTVANYQSYSLSRGKSRLLNTNEPHKCTMDGRMDRCKVTE
ncbi:hypothetical protein K3495_g8150 [Podosphaera aphanis]|nr:hypothetical protein K3495_g8150 [Podosphaera aphanis]